MSAVELIGEIAQAAFAYAKKSLDFASKHPKEVEIADRLLSLAMKSSNPGAVLRAAEVAAAKEAVRYPYT